MFRWISLICNFWLESYRGIIIWSKIKKYLVMNFLLGSLKVKYSVNIWLKECRGLIIPFSYIENWFLLAKHSSECILWLWARPYSYMCMLKTSFQLALINGSFLVLGDSYSGANQIRKIFENLRKKIRFLKIIQIFIK